ncbi:helix-turn-helix domain-containing protein [Blautia marasmi]|uniref:helix-turn-helix domain-containing protein n=1 Tax=Blautia marasmi TaxID=1917868 RepID=UPI00399F355C
MEIYKIIKNRRLELGLTLKDVAKALGVAESTISRYESSDIQNMGIDKIEALSKVLRCSPTYLMGWDSPKQCSNSLSELESLIIDEFRKSDDITKSMVLRVLSIDESKCIKWDTEKMA